MVEINNQRKASSICWRTEGTDNGRQKTRNHGYDVIVGGELFTDYSDHLANLSQPKPKSTGAGRYQPVGGMPTARSHSKDFSPQSSGLRHCSRLRSVALYRDWSWWYPSGNRPLQQYWLHCRALVMVSLSIRLTAWLQNSKKRAERSRLMYEQSHRDYLRSGYLHHRLPVMGC